MSDPVLKYPSMGGDARAARSGETTPLEIVGDGRYDYAQIIVKRLIAARPRNVASSFVASGDEIRRAEEMLAWPAGWGDDERSRPISRAAWDHALALLRESLADQLQLSGFMIGPCTDGSVDLSWEGGDYHLLINVQPPESGKPTTFYGASARPGERPVRGTLGGAAFLAVLLRWLR